MLKGVGFKLQVQLQVQLTIEKGSHFLPSLTDRELQKSNSAECLNKAQAYKNVWGFILTCPHIKGKP